MAVVSHRPSAAERPSLYGGGMSETPVVPVAALLDAVERCRYAAARLERTRAAAGHTSITEREALRYLRAASARDEPCTPKQLGEHLGITTPSMTSLLDRLEASGFLTRVPNPTDRRSSYVQLTLATPDRDDTDPLAAHIAALCAAIPLADAEIITRFLNDLAALHPTTTTSTGTVKETQ